MLDELCSRVNEVVLVAPSRPPGAPADVVFIAGDMTDEAVIARSRPDLASRALIACIDEADTMVVEGWVPRYVLEAAAKTFVRDGYSHLLISGLESADGSETDAARSARRLVAFGVV